MKKTRFVTLHPSGTNVDLIKDEGQIPYTLCANHNVDAAIVACHIDRKTANLKSVKGLKVSHFPLLVNNALTGAVYLLFNARKIDWLNIYFAGRQAYCWTKLYKCLNPKGHVYLKLDMDFRGCSLYEESEKERAVFRRNTEIVDIVSVESEAVKNRIQKYAAKDILLIENGISRLDFNPKVDQPRENVFITVGRLGTRQKATEILLQAFADSADRHDWKLKLVGKVDEKFKPYIDMFFQKHPELKNRVIFTGEIKDREQLYGEYCRAKVFVLPSRWESFGLSCGEALCCGCRLILTDTIPPAKEMTNNGRYGKIIEAENVDALTKELLNAVKQEYDQQQVDELVKYANEQFSWERVCKKLYREMKRVEKKVM